MDSVMIGGRMVLQQRKFTSFDYNALLNKVAEAVVRLREVNEEKRETMDMKARYVSSHCVGLACSGH